MGKPDYKAMFAKARAAGLKAAADCVPVPMVVVGDGRVYAPVMDGVCGFAWISVKPGNSPFANWLKAEGLARKSYEGGVSIWVGEFNQSMAKKEAYAYAFAEVLRDEGIKAYAGSRMD